MLSDLTIALSWNVTTATIQDVQKVRQTVTTLMDGVRKVTPKGGSYINEVCLLFHPYAHCFRNSPDPVNQG